MPIHDAARGFERAADAYDRARPEYPSAAVDAVFSALRLERGARLLDLGAGTGKLSRLAAARGAAVVALEPAAAMARRAVSAAGVAPVRGLAEALPFRAGVFDGASAASAFHWFDGARALREIHRVLRPGARLALLWNARDEAAPVPWMARFSAILDRCEGSTPRYRRGDWRRAFEEAPALFGPLEESHTRHVHVLSPEGVVERAASVSFVAAMAPDERERILDEVRALLASDPETAGRREIALPYRTDVYWCERLDAESPAAGGAPRV